MPNDISHLSHLNGFSFSCVCFICDCNHLKCWKKWGKNKCESSHEISGYCLQNFKKNNQRNSGSRVIKFDSLLTPNSMVSNIKLVLFFDLATKYHFHKALNIYYELKFPHISVSQLFWHSKIHTYYLTFPSNSRAKPEIYCYDRVD